MPDGVFLSQISNLEIIPFSALKGKLRSKNIYHQSAVPSISTLVRRQVE